MNEDNQWPKLKARVKRMCNHLLDLEKDFKVETWPSAEGMTIITSAGDDDSEEQYPEDKYEVLFNFCLSGGFFLDVRKKENEDENKNEEDENEK